jgi:hypothetical protein
LFGAALAGLAEEGGFEKEESFASIAIIYMIITMSISKNLNCSSQNPCPWLRVLLAGVTSDFNLDNISFKQY